MLKLSWNRLKEICLILIGIVVGGALLIVLFFLMKNYLIHLFYSSNFVEHPGKYFQKHFDEFREVGNRISKNDTANLQIDDRPIRQTEYQGKLYFYFYVGGFLENSQEFVYSVEGSPPPSDWCGGETMEGGADMGNNWYYVFCS